MQTRYVFGCLSLVFLILGFTRLVREGRLVPAARTWLILGVIFGIVSGWSWLNG
ncbi:MAG TPA: hypothetical protein VMT29_21510 [Steroidobacteraceae bacterium]|nr:hypothetical protein [Steroidobacteraceae bacterium]